MINYHEVVCFVFVQSLSRVQLFATPWTAARQASLSISNSWSLLKLMSIESVMPSNHLILCHPLLLLPSIFPSIRVFSSDSALCIRWPKCCSLRLTRIYSLPTPKAGASSQVRCQQGCTPSKGSRRQSFLASSSSWRLLQSS